MQIQLSEIINSIDISGKSEQRSDLNKGEKWIAELKNAINRGMGRNMLVLGEPGSGKSWACLRLAEALDFNGFTMDKVAFSAKDFLLKVSQAKKGDVIIYEEVGVNIASRQWWKHTGQNSLLQTVRYKNLFIIMNCPNLDFVDKQVQKLIHYTFKMMVLNQKYGFSIMRPMRLETDGQFSFTKKRYPMVDGVLLTQLKMNKPSIKLRHAYEKKAREYKEKLNAKYLAEERVKEKNEAMVIARGG